MHFSTLLTAASFAATAVEAAPRGAGFTRWLARQSHADREALRYREQRLEAEERHALHHRSYNQTNTTTIIRHPAPENDHAVTQLPIDDDGVVTIECSLPPVFVSTTTVDVTVFVTETPSAVPVVEETTTIEETESTSTVDREEETTPFVIVLPSSTVITEFVTTTSICDDGTETTIVLTQTTTEPCETTITDSSSMSTPVVPTLALTPNITTSQSTPSVVTSTPGVSTPSGSSSTPATVSSPSVSVTLPPDTTSASSSTTDCETDMTTPTPTPIATYDICIDINITPVITSKLTITATTPPEPTRTVCVDDHETGEPEEEALYCGVKGKPAGVYFLAEFIEERSGVPVTEEGCYQFCDSVMESTDGCQSYRFYHNELGAPRCALYGMPVASVVYDLDENQDDTWYDLACGSPSDESWSTVVPEESPKTTPATSSTSPTPVVSEAVTSETPTTSESLATSVISEPTTTTTTEPSTTSSVTPAPTPESDDDNVVNEPIDNSGTISDTGNVDSGNDMSDNQDSFNNNDNSGNSNSFNNNDNNDNNNNSGSLVDIDIGGLGN